MTRMLAIGLAMSLASTPARAQRPSGSAALCTDPATQVRPAKAYNDSVTLSAHPASIVGRVTNLLGQPTLARVRLLHSVTDAQPIQSIAPDSLGRFHIAPLAPGSYVLRISGLGYQDQWHAVRLIGAARDTLCVQLQAQPLGLEPLAPAGRVPGRVRHPRVPADADD